MILMLFLCSFKNTANAQNLSGLIKDAENGEKLSDVLIKNINSKLISISNNYGYYNIKCENLDSIKIHLIGYKDTTFIFKKNNRLINIYLNKLSIQLAEVEIINNSSKIIELISPGTFILNQKNIKEIPMFLGEKDVMRAIQSLPGFQEVKEGATGISIRGGSAGQNLIILDEANVYNANHLFGFFSTFNVDAISKVTAYKSNFPSQYGGRASGIIDISMREGNDKKFQIKGGIGLISSRISIEGPIIKDKASFLITARRTYLDLILRPFQSPRDITTYYFNDINAKIKFNLNLKNQLFLSLYTGDDLLNQTSKIPRSKGVLYNSSDLNWKNKTLSFRWNKIFNEKLFNNLSVNFSSYQMNFSSSRNQDYTSPVQFENILFGSSLQDLGIKTETDYFFSKNLTFKIGAKINVGSFTPRIFNYNSYLIYNNFNENALKENISEYTLFSSLKYNYKKISLYAGFRLVSFNNDQNYYRIEPRTELTYNLNTNNKLNISYSRMNQFLHLVSNTGNGLPTDTWIPSNSLLQPIKSDQFNFNFSKSFTNNINLSFDAYYKIIENSTEFKPNTPFLKIFSGSSEQNSFKWSENLIQGKTWSYGYEVFLNSSRKRFSGQLGYTLAWSISKYNELNNGKAFFNNVDRRHVLEVGSKYQINKKYTISAFFNFTSGFPLTSPDIFFFREDRGYNYLEYNSSFNNFRTVPYHRLDLGLNIRFKKNRSLDINIYNAYNRKNPYNYDIATRFDLPNRNFQLLPLRQNLVPIVPSVSYNFE